MAIDRRRKRNKILSVWIKRREWIFKRIFSTIAPSQSQNIRFYTITMLYRIDIFRTRNTKNHNVFYIGCNNIFPSPGPYLPDLIIFRQGFFSIFLKVYTLPLYNIIIIREQKRNFRSFKIYYIFRSVQ